MAATTTSSSLAMTYVLWALRVLMAALFLFAGLAKLSGQEMMVQEFGLLPVGQWLGAILAALAYLQRDSIRARFGM